MKKEQFYSFCNKIDEQLKNGTISEDEYYDEYCKAEKAYESEKEYQEELNKEKEDDE